MQRLILMRHATAETAAPEGDRARPLSAAGRLDARRIGEALAARGLKPDHALVSNATRTRQTWDEISDRFGDVVLEIDPGLYNATADTLANAVEAVEESAGCLLLLAHNPGIHQLAVDLLIAGAAPASAMDRLQTGFPTGAAAVFAVDAAGRCAFEAFLTPADTDRTA
jgi:phosphohistidine phosphatase